MRAWVHVRRVLAIVAVGVSSGCESSSTLAGVVSDAVCAAAHVWDEHGPPLTEPECVLQCNKRGAKFVLVTDDEVFEIANQEHPNLDRAAGREVMVQGRIYDGFISISRVDVANQTHGSERSANPPPRGGGVRSRGLGSTKHLVHVESTAQDLDTRIPARRIDRVVARERARAI